MKIKIPPRAIEFRGWHQWSGSYAFNVTFNPGNIYSSKSNRRGWIYEQYTGMKDNHGVEIYEGDIVRVAQHWNGDSRIREYISVVRFDELAWWTKEESLANLMYSPSLIEVIGNIHQSPEALNA